jgi:hypothetical protein
MLAQVREIHRVSNEGRDKCGCPSRLRRVCGTRRGSTPGIRVLAARPLKVRESWATELFRRLQS